MGPSWQGSDTIIWSYDKAQKKAQELSRGLIIMGAIEIKENNIIIPYVEGDVFIPIT